MESCFTTGLFGAEAMVYSQWQSHLAGLRTGSIPSPLLVSSLPTPPTVVASPAAWPHWGLDPKTDLAETKKKNPFFSHGESTVLRRSRWLPALLVQARGQVQHVLRGWRRSRVRQCCCLGRTMSPPKLLWDTSVAEKSVPQQVSAGWGAAANSDGRSNPTHWVALRFWGS